MAIRIKYRPEAHSRTTDPETSRMAADQLKPGRMLTRLYAVYAEHPEGLTAEEAAELAGYTAEDGAWKRVSDLSRQGLVYPTGEMRPGRSGRLQRVLSVDEEGRGPAEKG